MDRIIRLVVVDNSPRARHGLCAVLATQPGLEIVGEASHGAEALALIDAKRPDAILMDVRMPVMNGIQAASAIRNRWPQVRVILISLYDEYEQEALESGADAFLVKGCPAEELVAAIAGTLPHQGNDYRREGTIPGSAQEAGPGKPKESTMENNPWNWEISARLQREHIQEEMRHIRLEEIALKSRPDRPAALVRAWLSIKRWLEVRKKESVQSASVKRAIGIGRSSI